MDDADDLFDLDFTNLVSTPPASAVVPPVVPPAVAASPLPTPPAPPAPPAFVPPTVVPTPPVAAPPAPAKAAAPAAPKVELAQPKVEPPKPKAAPLELVPVDVPPAPMPSFEFVVPDAAPPLSAIPPSTIGGAVAEDNDFDMFSVIRLDDAPAPKAKPVAAAPVKPAKSAGLKLLEEVALLHAAGNSVEACSKLEAALRGGKLGTETEPGWSMLFDLLQALNRRSAFETLADAYAKRFEKSAPAWLESDDVDASLETGGAASVALNGTLSASSEAALKKLVTISESNPVVRLGLTKVTDADNDGCRLLLDTLRAFKKKKRECLIGGAEEFAAMLAGKIEMMRRDREETWLLLLELHQQAGKEELFEDMAVGYAVTFEVSPPSWERIVLPKSPTATPKRVTKDPMLLEGELLIGMGSISALAAAAKGKETITIETDRLQRIDEPSAQALYAELSPLATSGLHIRIRGASTLISMLFTIVGLDKIATIEVRRR